MNRNCGLDLISVLCIFARHAKLALGKACLKILGSAAMAKPTTILIRLTSTAGTGFYYVTKKNPRTQTEKLEFRKYDPVVRKHVTFKESKIK